MLIRVLTSVGGHKVGTEVDVPADVASRWIDAGDVEPVDGVREFETAAVAATVETAAKPRGKRR